MDKMKKNQEMSPQPFNHEMVDEMGAITHGKKKTINTRHNSNLDESLDIDEKKHRESRVNYSGPDQVIDDNEDDFNTASDWNSDWKK